MNTVTLRKAVKHVKERFGDTRIAAAMILGSGWSRVVDTLEVVATLGYTEIPSLGATQVEGHAGRLVLARVSGQSILIFQGRRHYYEGLGWEPVIMPVFILFHLGVRNVLLTNAAGGINTTFAPGDLMCIDDHINLMGANPLLGENDPALGPRFPDQTAVYNPRLRGLLDRAAAACGIPLRHGIYLAGSGPTYETPAEVRAWRTLGADAVGMSTVPEAMVANAAGLRVAGLSCITNMAAGISTQSLTHAEVLATTERAQDAMTRLLMAFFAELLARPE